MIGNEIGKIIGVALAFFFGAIALLALYEEGFFGRVFSGEPVQPKELRFYAERFGPMSWWGRH
jgi:hypothetical protein